MVIVTSEMENVGVVRILMERVVIGREFTKAFYETLFRSFSEKTHILYFPETHLNECLSEVETKDLDLNVISTIFLFVTD